jgi:multicomponent Na+:H+ antiporter subunit G
MEWVAAALVVAGASFMLLAAVGVARLPDVWMRMHASTKSATFGIGCMALALAASHLHDLGVVMRSIIIIGFVFQTAPVAGHMIGRAAYLMGVVPWRGTKLDELKGRYDPETHSLSGGDASRVSIDTREGHGPR